MIIHTKIVSKKRKVSEKIKKQNGQWLNSLPKRRYSGSPVSISTEYSSAKRPTLINPRSFAHIPSVTDPHHDCTKKKTLFYTGDKMKGIGTLHKSNAVPIFTDEEAKDQASMRR
jgi:hypothetical protein